MTARIIALPRSVKFLVATSMDMLAAMVATLAVGMVISPNASSLSLDYLALVIGSPLVLIPGLYLSGSYAAVVRFVSAYTMLRILRGMLIGYLALGAIVGLLGILPQVWKLLVLSPLAAGFLLTSWRLAAASWLRSPADGPEARRVLIYGAGNAGVQLAAALMTNLRYRAVAFVDDRTDFRGRMIFGLKVYSPQDLPRLKQSAIFERVLLAIPSATRSRRREILEHLEKLSIKVLVMPALDELASGECAVDDLREVQIEDLLGRDPVEPIQPLLDSHLKHKSVMVTGAGGSIGTELCRQALRCGASKLVLFEMCEFALYSIEQELRPLAETYQCELVSVLGNVCKQRHVARTMLDHGVQTIYHAAAYKHVPLVEQNVVPAVYNNIFGTLATVRAALTSGVENFVLISTDKAVRPTGVMGKSKRVCELLVQALAAQHSNMKMSMVRFGNVLASSGSVVPLFRSQIRGGGAVTVTHPDITRYFMTIPEAAQLVIQAGAMGSSGEVFVLDMGEPVKILHLAERMIRLSGLVPCTAEQPNGDIEIRFTGLRPGEKLYEELLIGNDPQSTQHQRIFLAREQCLSWEVLGEWLSRLQLAIDRDDAEGIMVLLAAVVDAPSLIDNMTSTKASIRLIEHKNGVVPGPKEHLAPSFTTQSAAP